MKIGKAWVYVKHTIKKGFRPSVIWKLQMENEKEWVYKHKFLYIFINIYIIYHEDMQVVL